MPAEIAKPEAAAARTRAVTDTSEQHFARYRRCGDAEALGAVFDALAPKLLLVAAHLAGGDAAEDLVQTTFVDAIRQQDRWDERRPLVPWLCGILANHVRELRRQARRAPDPQRLLLREVEGPDAAAAAHELVDSVHAAVEQLPRHYRQVLSLRFVHGLELQQIARALDEPLGTVKTRLFRGTALLRRALPAGLATALGSVLLPGRGLAAVRAAVLGHAGAAAGAAAGTTAAAVAGTAVVGAMLMQKLLLAVGVVVVAVGGWFAVAARSAPPVVQPGDREVSRAPVARAGTESVAKPDAAAPVPTTAPASVAAATAQRTEAATTGSIDVQVNWKSDGSPVAGASVGCWSLTDRQGLTQTADSDGRARFADLQPGGYWLSVRRSRGASQRLEVSSGEASACELAIEGDQSFRVRVVDAQDQPAAGAEIWCTSDDGEGARALPNRTGADGVVAYHGFPLASVWARKAGLVPSRAATLPREGMADELRLVLGAAGCLVQGTVVDPDGRTVGGAIVAIATDDSLAGLSAKEPAMEIRCTTDAQGRFACSEVPVGNLPVLAFGDGFAACTARVQTSPTQPAVVTMSLQRGACIHGRVTHRDRTAFVGVTVELSRATGDLGFSFVKQDAFSRRAVTDAEGNFTFAAVYPASTRLSFHAEGELIASRLLDLHDGETCRCELTLPDGEDIAGSVVDADGKAMPRMRVDVLGRTADRFSPFTERTTFTDADGRFLLQGMPAGQYSLTVSDPDASGAAARVWLASAANVRPGDPPLELRVEHRLADRSWIQGRVVWPDGAELQRVELSLYPARREIGFTVPQQRLQPGTDTYCIGPVPPGDYDLLCDVEGHQRLRQHLHVGAAKTQQAGPFRLDLQVPLRLRLQRPDGSPVRGASVLVDIFGGGQGVACSEESPGLYRSLALTPAVFTVVLHGPDFAAERLQVEVTADARRMVEHRVQPASATTLRFFAAGPPRERWVAQLRLRIVDPTGTAIVEELVTIDGKDPFDWSIGLRPGSYSLSASLASLGNGAAELPFVVGAAAPDGQIVEVHLAKQ